MLVFEVSDIQNNAVSREEEEASLAIISADIRL